MRRYLASGAAAAVAAAGMATLPTNPAGSAAGPVLTLTATAAAKPKRAPANARMMITMGLERREQQARDALRAVSDPTSDRYRHFPSRQKIRKKYGVTKEALRAVSRSAATEKLDVALDATGTFVSITGKVKHFEDWLRAKGLAQPLALPGGKGTVLNFAHPKVPKNINSYVEQMFAYDFQATYPAAPQATDGAVRQSGFAGINRGTPTGCVAEQAPELSRYVYSPNELRDAYGVTRLPHSEGTGNATRVVIIAEGSGFAETNLALAQACFGLPDVAFRRVAVAGLAGALPSQNSEGDLDVQVVQGVLPAGSVVHVIESSPVDPRTHVQYSTAFGLPRLPDVTTSSYTNCENVMRQDGQPQVRAMTESVLLRMSLAGTSNLSAAGDSGSSACWDQDTGKGPKHIAVNYLPSSPHVTAVGGSRIVLRPDNQRADEGAWNDLGLAKPAGPATVAGGGGRSVLFDRPWWQPKSITHSQARTLPDLAAHASAGPGWPLAVAVESQVVPVAGTSAATPFVAAAFGIMTARERQRGKPPLGLVQPLLYRLAQTKPATFFDITKGQTDLFDVGCCRAQKGYDLATGLGSPNLDRIYRSVPQPG